MTSGYSTTWRSLASSARSLTARATRCGRGAVGAQYYWLHHADPVALLGYIAVLEGDPPREDELEAAAGRTRLPHDAFRTFISHAKLDPNHKQELDDFIDSLSLTQQQQALLAVSAITTVGGLRKVFATLSA